MPRGRCAPRCRQCLYVMHYVMQYVMQYVMHYVMHYVVRTAVSTVVSSSAYLVPARLWLSSPCRQSVSSRLVCTTENLAPQREQESCARVLDWLHAGHAWGARRRGGRA